MDADAIDFQLPLPIFPLPNCVLFPGVVQPLHIFEPRYKEMIAHALDGPSLIALALLQPGWEKNYYSTPPVHEVVCVGKIVAHEQLDDGKYNLLLHGVTRARLLREKKHGLFRVGMAEPIEEILANDSPAASLQRTVLRNLFAKTALKDLTISTSLETLFDESVATARLIDVLAFTLIQDVPTKQRLLEEPDPFTRGELLLRELLSLASHLDAGKPAAAPVAWPPTCSPN